MGLKVLLLNHAQVDAALGPLGPALVVGALAAAFFCLHLGGREVVPAVDCLLLCSVVVAGCLEEGLRGPQSVFDP